MSKFETKSVMPRYMFFVIIMTLLALVVIMKAGYIMTVKKNYWLKVASRQKVDSVAVMPTRGNILSCDGQLMASSLPEYRLTVDFKVMHDTKTDTLWNAKEDSICNGLAEIFPEISAAEFKTHLREGKNKMKQSWPIIKRRVNYNDFCAVRELPIFRLSRYRGGFSYEEFNARKRPFGSIASRTIGDMFGSKDTARCGLELSYDSLLRGQQGIMHKRKVLNKYLSIIDAPAVNGCDIVTTIDVNMQDLAERALLEELQLPEVNGEMGVAILMEVATGDVKAIVNMTKCEDGQYREVVNSAVGYRCEPGSVFKPASIMVALDDGVVDTSFIIHTGCGIMDMHSRQMKDHNWATQGGYGDINVARSLEVSSNIGVSYVIDHFFSQNPEKYREGLCRIGMHEDLHLPIVGYHPPRIPHFTNNRGQVEDKTQLPWMSIGYGTMIAPINTLTFYNAIANNGKMMQPRFVKAAVKNGVTIAEYPPVVLKQHICKESTLRTMQTILRHVVSQGLGRKAGSKNFQVSGKTGTAQVSAGKAGYHSGTTGYWLSFAGYFPSDKPRYSCIVCIKKWGLPASGGGMSGVVFHKISEGVMARDIKQSIAAARSPWSQRRPDVKRGNAQAANAILDKLGLRGQNSASMPKYGMHTMPDVMGMGARDAVYLLEKRGLKVHLSGRGRVCGQSIAPGTAIKRGVRCDLQLEI